MTYVYTDSTAVLGPLALRADPHGYDLCGRTPRRLSAPRGWEVIRLALGPEPGPSPDDLLALADAVREVGFAYDQPATGRRVPPTDDRPASWRSGGVRHLTVLADPDA